MPTADKLTIMNWFDRRRADRQERINEQLRRGGLLPEDCTPMTTAEAGSMSHPHYEPPRRITVRAVNRTLGNRSRQ